MLAHDCVRLCLFLATRAQVGGPCCPCRCNCRSCLRSGPLGLWSTLRFQACAGVTAASASTESFERGAAYAEALQAVQRIIPQDAPIFAEPDAMAVRYRLYRPLAYAFKDGSSYLYSQDAQGAARWLDLTAIRDKQGLTAAWLASGAQWILCGTMSERQNIEQQGTVLWSNDRWFIAKRGIAAEHVTQ